MAKFLSQDYENGLVYERLEFPDARYLVGLDCVSSRSAAYLSYRTEENEWSRPEKLTGICDDNVKYSPIEWDTDNGSPWTQTKESISRLWESVKNSSSMLAEDNGSHIVLAVGCPDTPAWMGKEAREDFQYLVWKTPGISNVIVTPESTAAIMAAVHCDPDFSFRDGIAVINAGAFSVDCTAMAMGKTMLTRNIWLGGADIDHAMVRAVLRQNGIQFKDKWESQEAARKMREYKENFYRKGTSGEGSLDMTFLLDYVQFRENGAFPEDNEILNRILENGHSCLDFSGISLEYRLEPLSRVKSKMKIGRKVNFHLKLKLSLPFTIDEEWMQKVLNQDDFLERKTNKKSTWAECIEAHLEGFSSAVKVAGIECRTVILTGGTSGLIREQAEKVFVSGEDSGNIRILLMEPENLIAQGLCYSIIHERKAAKQVREYQDSAENAYHYLFKKHLRDYSYSLVGKENFDLIWEDILRVVKLCDDGICYKCRDMMKFVSISGQSEKITEDASEWLSNSIFNWAREDAGYIYTDASGEGIQVPVPDIPFPFPDIVWNVDDTCNSASDTSEDENSALFSKLCDIGKDLVHYNPVQKFFRSLEPIGVMNYDMPPKACHALAEKMKDQEFKELCKTKFGGKEGALWECIMNAIQYSADGIDISEITYPRVEAALGVLLLLVFENYDDGTGQNREGGTVL